MNLGVGKRERERVEAEVLECLKELGGGLPVDVAWMRFKKGYKPLLPTVAMGLVMEGMEADGSIFFNGERYEVNDDASD